MPKISAAELTNLWNLPNNDIRPLVEGVPAQWLPPPAKAFISDDPRFLQLGSGYKSDGTLAPIGLRYDLLRYILWVTAPMGRGKSEWLKNLFACLMKAGAGFMALDCKGTDLVNGTLPLIPLERERDVSILDLGGTKITGEDLRTSMNLLSPRFGLSLGLEPSQLASTVLQIFVTLDPKFNDAPGMKQFANFGLLALLEGEPNATIMHLIRFFGDEEYRADVCSKLKPGQVYDFWNRRFDQMPQSQKASLTSFERRLDQLITYPELSAMLVSSGCSINLRELMDNKGILLAGIKATEGQIASIAVTLLLTQLTLAALSRNGVPGVEDSQGFAPYRPDWPLIIDEVQIVANANTELFKIILSQFRAFRIGTVLVHQNIEQIAGVRGPLEGNAQNRLILGTEIPDAQLYQSMFGGLGLTKEDFINMETFAHQYLKLYGTGAPLFSARMPPMVKPIDEPMPKPVYRNWKAVRAPARNALEQRLDDQIAAFRELAAVDYDQAVARLGLLSKKDPSAFEAYCERTRAHRLEQRAFILDNPGCVPVSVEGQADPMRGAVEQKEKRIRILSALRANTPRLETEAMAYALLAHAQEATERMVAFAAEEKANKRSGKAKTSTAKSPAIAGMSSETPAIEHAVTGETARLPTFQELSAKRRQRGRRDVDDISAGFEELNEVL